VKAQPPRARRKRDRRNLSQWLALAPWWFSVVLSVSVFILLQYVLPPLLDDTHIEASGAVLKFLSPYIAILLIVPLPFALFNREEHGRRVAEERQLDELRDLDQDAFVARLIPAFRSEGYLVEEQGDTRLVDLILRRGGEKTIVCCGEWNASLVSARYVAKVREAQLELGAAGAKVVTCGDFRPAARRFERTTSVELVDGPALVKLFARHERAQQQQIDEILDLPFAHALRKTHRNTTSEQTA